MYICTELWILGVTQDRWIRSTGPVLPTSFNIRNVWLITIPPSFQLLCRNRTDTYVSRFKHIFLLEQAITVTEYSMPDENRFSSLLYHTTHYSYKRHFYQWTNLRQLCFWAYGNLPPGESYLCQILRQNRYFRVCSSTALYRKSGPIRSATILF